MVSPPPPPPPPPPPGGLGGVVPLYFNVNWILSLFKALKSAPSLDCFPNHLNLKFIIFPLTLLVAFAVKLPPTVPFIVYSVFGLEDPLNLTPFTVTFRVSSTAFTALASCWYVLIPADFRLIFTVNVFPLRLDPVISNLSLTPPKIAGGFDDVNSIPSGRVILAVKLVSIFDTSIPFATAPTYWFSKSLNFCFIGFTFRAPVISRISDLLAS